MNPIWRTINAVLLDKITRGFCVCYAGPDIEIHRRKKEIDVQYRQSESDREFHQTSFTMDSILF